VNTARPYHHGDLRPALLAAAVEVIEEVGPAQLSLREVARRAGVTHPAAAYHFGDKAGLLTALATAGYRMLGEVLAGSLETTGSFTEVGIAYVGFAVRQRAHFEVMYRPELYRSDDPDLLEAKRATAFLLYGSEDPDTEQLTGGVASWAFVHGMATLWLNGNLPIQLGDDAQDVTRLVATRVSIDRG
jgi:AcrR family transcriptional regulator